MSMREVFLEGNPPWGFCMNGGADAGHPLRISRVKPGSKAESKGVREGDLITSINGQSTKCLTNSESHALLRTVKENLLLGLNEDKNASPRRRSREIKNEGKRPIFERKELFDRNKTSGKPEDKEESSPSKSSDKKTRSSSPYPEEKYKKKERSPRKGHSPSPSDHKYRSRSRSKDRHRSEERHRRGRSYSRSRSHSRSRSRSRDYRSRSRSYERRRHRTRSRSHERKEHVRSSYDAIRFREEMEYIKMMRRKKKEMGDKRLKEEALRMKEKYKAKEKGRGDKDREREREKEKPKPKGDDDKESSGNAVEKANQISPTPSNETNVRPRMPRMRHPMMMPRMPMMPYPMPYPPHPHMFRPPPFRPYPPFPPNRYYY